MNRKTLLLGAASAVLALPLAFPAMADDLVISTTTTNAVKTSEPAPLNVASPGDITVTSTGQVNVTNVGVPDDADFPPAAVTLNSDNDVTNDGTISAVNSDTPLAVQIVGGNTGTFTNNGIITVFAEGPNPAASTSGVAVLVNGANPFNGSLVFGANSQTTAAGTASRAIAILTGVNGNVSLDGTITASGTAATAIEVDGKIDGAITNSAIVTTNSGVESTTSVPLPPASAIYVHHDITGGIQNNAEGVFGTQGSFPAVRISAEDENDDDDGNDEPDPSTNITIDEYGASGYSFYNLGTIEADGRYPNTNAVAMQLGGSVTADTIFTTGFYNGGIVDALGTSANDNATNADETASNATALIVGNRAKLPQIYNDADAEITATTGGPAGGRAIGIDIAETADVVDGILVNHGRIAALSGTDSDTLSGLVAYGIRDRSGTLVNVTNTGTISAVAEGRNGRGYALDLPEATDAVSINNTGTIIGDIHFGDSVDSAFRVNGATASATGFFESSGNVDIYVSEGGVGGVLTTRGVRNADVFNIGDNGVLNIQIAQSLDPTIRTEGVTTLSALSQLHVVPTTFLVEGNYELIESEDTLTIGDLANLQATVESELPYLFGNSTLSESGESLYLNVQRLTEDQIGLTGNARRLYDAVSAAALEDNGMGLALLGLNNGTEVQGALEQFVPFDGRASRMVVSAMTDPMVGNVANRQRNLLMQNESYGQGGAWFEGGYTSFSNSTSAGFDGNGAGGAIGLDWGEDDAGHFGIAYSFFHGSADATGAANRETRMDWNVLTFYAGFDRGPIFVNAQLNAGVADVEGERRVDIGSETRVSETRGWNEVLGSGAISAGYVFDAGSFRFAPQVGVDYFTINRSDYTETNGGNGVDLKIRNSFEDEFRGFAGIAFSGGIPLGNVTLLPRGYAGVQHSFRDNNNPITAEFLAVPGMSFRTYNPALDGSAFIGGLGVDVSMGAWLAGLEYSTIIHPNATVHNFAADASVRF